jgi:phage N-6-adenine-methyltransferase
MVAYRRRRRKHRLAVHFSSRTCEWATPPELFAALDARFGPFTLDPCATPDNAKCARYYTREQDGLAQPWGGRVFVNPPYGREAGRWVARAWQAVAYGEAELAVLLLKAATETSWWHDYAGRGEVEFLPGRVRFGGARDGAPFPSAVVVFRNAPGVTKPGAE